MAALETQVGQIFINNKKLSRSFVSLLSEKLAESGAEIYALVEIATLNPAAWPEHEKMFKYIAAIIRRNFKKDNPNGFENSVAQINDSLTKMAADGNTSWVGQINACLAVREGENLYVATTGKIHAYLFRDKQFSEIADHRSGENPLKTFEHFTMGKVLKGDFLILSTTQLFNYVSVERLKRILTDLPLAAACQTIGELIKELADESVSFGTFILELGFNEEFAQASVMKILNATEKKSIFAGAQNFASKIKAFAAHTVLLTKQSRIPKINLKNIDTALLKDQARNYADFRRLKALPQAKKFFLAAALLCVILLIGDIAITLHINGRTKTAQKDGQVLTDIQKKIDDANAAYIYNNPAQALLLMQEAQTELKSIPANASLKNTADKLYSQLDELQNSINHVKTVQTTELLQYSSSALDRIFLIDNKLILVNSAANYFVDYDIIQKIYGTNVTLTASPSINIASTNGILLLEGSDGGINQFDPKTKLATKQIVTLPLNTTGLSSFGAPIKIYTADKSTNRILVSALNNPAAPSNYLKQVANLSTLIDQTIDSDGSLWLLKNNTIEKYVGGKNRNFNLAATPFGDGSKILTDKTNLYVLNTSTHRIVVIDKKRAVIVTQYASDQFTKLKDFALDSSAKLLYILNNDKVYSLSFDPGTPTIINK